MCRRMNSFQVVVCPRFGSRCDVVAAQDVAHRLVGNEMTQVGQLTGDAVVTPTCVLAGEANDQFLYLGGDPGTARMVRHWGPSNLWAMSRR